MRTPLVLGLALTSLPAVAGDPIAFFADGAGSVSVDGVVEVPLLRGVDTSGRPAVLANGKVKEGEEPDEFLVTLSLSEGPSKCTEAVVGTLGGWVQDRTVARQGSLFGKVTKTATKAGYIPELHIGDLVVKDVHCEVDSSVNSLAIPGLDELAVAILPSKGVVQFTASDNAAALLDAVGNTQAAVVGQPGVTWSHGTKKAVLGPALFGSVTLFGKPALVAFSHDRQTMVRSGFEAIPWTRQRSGVLYTAGSAEIGGSALPDSDYLVYDGSIDRLTNGEETIEVDAVLGNDVLFAVDIAVDPKGRKIALAPASEVKWTDPGDKLLDKAKEAFEKAGEKGETASLLTPLPERGDAFAAFDLGEEACVAHVFVDAPTKAAASGVRAFGAAKVTMREVPCDSVLRASEDEPEGAGAAEPEDDGDEKEASRQADWGDALWKHGRYSEAYAAYATALDKAGNDCSYALDFAEKSFALGDVDAALTAAGTSAELYDAWASQSLETRLDKGQGDAQADDCHRAWGLRAAAMLARGSHSKVEGVFDAHMDLDEDLAQVVALSRLETGRPDKAHGPLLQALDVGGRGDPKIHATLGLVGARMDRDRIAEASLVRLLELEGDWTLEDALAAVAVAREIGGEDRVKTFTEVLIAERPASAAAWAVYGLEAERRGDGTAAAAAADKASLAQAAIDRSAGSSDGYAHAASLRAVTGDSAGAARDLEIAGNAPGASASLVAARAIVAAMSGDSTALDTELQALARQDPMHPLGTLKLLSALPRMAPAPE